MPVSLATGLEAAMSKTRRSERLFESIGSQGEQLEPKWHSHFGNYIDNTLLALHKFQAKKQIIHTEHDVICSEQKKLTISKHSQAAS